MRKVIRRIGTGLWVVLGIIGGGVVALAALAQLDAQNPDQEKLLVKFVDFRPLYGDKKVLVVDVRDRDSFAAGHIAGAIHVPLPEIESRSEEVRKASGGRLVVTYCSCPFEGTSLAAASRLSGRGIKAQALVGGFTRWVEFGGEVERGKENAGSKDPASEGHRDPVLVRRPGL